MSSFTVPCAYCTFPFLKQGTLIDRTWKHNIVSPYMPSIRNVLTVCLCGNGLTLKIGFPLVVLRGWCGTFEYLPYRCRQSCIFRLSACFWLLAVRTRYSWKRWRQSDPTPFYAFYSMSLAAQCQYQRRVTDWQSGGAFSAKLARTCEHQDFQKSFGCPPLQVQCKDRICNCIMTRYSIHSIWLAASCNAFDRQEPPQDQMIKAYRSKLHRSDMSLLLARKADVTSVHLPLALSLCEKSGRRKQARNHSAWPAN